MKKTILLAAAVLFLAGAAIGAPDAEKARKKLAKEDIAFTPEMFLKKVFSGDEDIVQLFLDAGMPVDTADDKGWTALHRRGAGRQREDAGRDPQGEAGSEREDEVGRHRALPRGGERKREERRAPRPGGGGRQRRLLLPEDRPARGGARGGRGEGLGAPRRGREDGSARRQGPDSPPPRDQQLDPGRRQGAHPREGGRQRENEIREDAAPRRHGLGPAGHRLGAARGGRGGGRARLLRPDSSLRSRRLRADADPSAADRRGSRSAGEGPERADPRESRAGLGRGAGGDVSEGSEKIPAGGVHAGGGGAGGAGCPESAILPFGSGRGAQEDGPQGGQEDSLRKGRRTRRPGGGLDPGRRRRAGLAQRAGPHAALRRGRERLGRDGRGSPRRRRRSQRSGSGRGQVHGVRRHAGDAGRGPQQPANPEGAPAGEGGSQQGQRLRGQRT